MSSTKGEPRYAVPDWPAYRARLPEIRNMTRLMIVWLLASLAPVSAQEPQPPDQHATEHATLGGSTTDAGSHSLYTVEDGNKVDQKTLMGWKTWRALACERCHGAAQEGLVGPPLVESMKTLTKEEFHKAIMEGRPEKGMPPFNTSAMVNQNWEGLYAYLKGRADGEIQPGRLSPIEH